MYIKQISVLLANENGKLRALTNVLDEKNINMKAACLIDTEDYGILRCIVDRPDEAVEAINAAGFTASITRVLAVGIDDTPGGLNKVLKVLDEAGMSIDYIYSMLREGSTTAVIIFKLSDIERAGKVLEAAGVKMMCREDLQISAGGNN